MLDALPSLPRHFLTFLPCNEKASLRWNGMISRMQSISVPPLTGLHNILFSPRACLCASLEGDSLLSCHFPLSSMWAHESDRARVCLCTHRCAQNMRASIKDGTGRQDVTHAPTTRNPCPKTSSHLELLAFVSVRFGRSRACRAGSKQGADAAESIPPPPVFTKVKNKGFRQT